MNANYHTPSRHSHISNSSHIPSNTDPPETVEVGLSTKKNWGIIHNNSSSNRRKKSINSNQHKLIRV